MSDATTSNGGSHSEEDANGVLANLPHSRTQRTSARRASARKSSARSRGDGAARAGENGRSVLTREPGEAHPAPPPADEPSAAAAPAGERRRATAKRATAQPRKRAASTPRRSSTVGHDPAPRQGYDSGPESASGPVQPPGGVELVASVAEIVGEVAKAGFSTGERLIRDVLSRLPLS